MKLDLTPIHVFLALALPLAPAVAQTITVDITDADLIDVDPATATVANLPGPDGHVSFSEAMIASNNTPGRQTIAFAIPTSEWTYLPWLYPGRAVITGMMFYANAQDPVTIDGTTQTAFTGDTNPTGREVVILRGGGLWINADQCIVRGLDRTTLVLDRSHGVVETNSEMGIRIDGSAGGFDTLVRGNDGGYVDIDQSSDNVVVGNTFYRVRVLGAVIANRPAINNRIGGATLAERNFITGSGTLNSQGMPGGFAVQIFDATRTTVENNWIGTTPDGLQQGHPQTTHGILFDGEHHDTLIRGNRIAGIRARTLPQSGPGWWVGSGITIDGTGSGVTIVGNAIGLDANGQATLGAVTGIAFINHYISSVRDVTIGGVATGAGNEIAGHLGVGVNVANTFSGVRISGNSIHDNGGLGVDLITSGFLTGVTPNDPLDVDVGANGLQNFPVLQLATAAGASTRIVGTLPSSANAAFAVEFFASSQCDPTGHGEGQLFLGSLAVNTDSSGNGRFDALLPAAPSGWFITATATALATGSTSEFSACLALGGSAQQWGDVGRGLAGVNGVPVLTGSGPLTAASTITWTLANARPNAAAVFVIGLTRAQLPLFGGVLVPSPDLLVVVPTDAAGVANLQVYLAQGLRSGTEVAVQAWVFDPAGPLGWSASNAVAAVAP
jgi:hypothetical protein